VAGKGDIVEASRKAAAVCHSHGIMVVAWMIFGFSDDDKENIIENYRFVKSIEADTFYCQILTPYPIHSLVSPAEGNGLVGPVRGAYSRKSESQ
jgi:anaerobic magnesium-protoporphyrin IX monomethyl ester cyclase